MWISKKRFKELEEKYEYLENTRFSTKTCIYDRIDRIERIMKYARDGEITYVERYRTNLETLYYVYLDNKEYEISVPFLQKIYDVKRTKKKDVIIVMSREEATDENPVYCNFIIDLQSGDKVEITLDEMNELKIQFYYKREGII